MGVIDPLEARFGALIAALQPAARAELAKRIAKTIQRSQSTRIGAQKNPDGSDYEPRKPQLRNKKKNLRPEGSTLGVRAGMFRKLRTPSMMDSKGTADGAFVGFIRDVQRIALVHQNGLRDRVNRFGKEADYPQRRLFGITDDDENDTTHLITEHLARVL